MYSSERHLMMHVHSIVNQHYTEMTVEREKKISNNSGERNT